MKRFADKILLALAASALVASVSAPASAGEASADSTIVSRPVPVVQVVPPLPRRVFVPRYRYASSCMNIGCRGFILLGVGH